MFEEQAIDPAHSHHWSYSAQAVRDTFNFWCKHMLAQGGGENTGSFKARANGNDGIVLETPVGEVFSRLTFMLRSNRVWGRAVFYRPAVPAINRHALPVMSLLVDPDGDVFTGDAGDNAWPAGHVYPYSKGEAFGKQIMFALLNAETREASAAQ